jgi:hypothetical protein
MNIVDQLVLKLKLRYWAKLKANIYPSFNMSHSQFGEDMVIRSLSDIDMDKMDFMLILALTILYFYLIHIISIVKNGVA